jgi:hypothetical protein
MLVNPNVARPMWLIAFGLGVAICGLGWLIGKESKRHVVAMMEQSEAQT